VNQCPRTRYTEGVCDFPEGGGEKRGGGGREGERPSHPHHSGAPKGELPEGEKKKRGKRKGGGKKKKKRHNHPVIFCFQHQGPQVVPKEGKRGPPRGEGGKRKEKKERG